MRPRLLHVFPTFGIGGMQTQFATVANALGGDFEHVVVSLDGRSECRAKLAIGTPCEMAAAPAGASRGLSHAPSIASFLRRQAPDLVITYNWGAVEWCLVNRLFGSAPGIHCEHGFGADEADRPHLRRSLFRWLALGRSTPLVVPSATLEALALRHWRLRPAQVRHIPNGIDLDLMSRRAGSTPAPFTRQPDDFVVGTVAPLRAEKSLGRLLRAFAAAAADDPRWRLVIAGDGPERSRLEVIAHQLAIRQQIVFLGSLAEPAPALALFDVFALTSETEQMPYSILEAMALSKPVVATDVGDIARMVASENRPLVRPRTDEAGLAAALRRLAGDRGLRERLGEDNRRRCRDAYDESRMCDAFRSLYGATLRR
jgi:glycosyltransferase involved in cell wall biosynthesis